MRTTQRPDWCYPLGLLASVPLETWRRCWSLSGGWGVIAIAGWFHSVVMQVGPPSASAEDGEQHEQEHDAAGADSRVFRLKKRIESRERFVRRSAIGGIISMSICEGLV